MTKKTVVLHSVPLSYRDQDCMALSASAISSFFAPSIVTVDVVPALKVFRLDDIEVGKAYVMFDQQSEYDAFLRVYKESGFDVTVIDGHVSRIKVHYHIAIPSENIMMSVMGVASASGSVDCDDIVGGASCASSSSSSDIDLLFQMFPSITVNNTLESMRNYIPGVEDSYLESLLMSFCRRTIDIDRVPAFVCPNENIRHLSSKFIRNGLIREGFGVEVSGYCSILCDNKSPSVKSFTKLSKKVVCHAGKITFKDESSCERVFKSLMSSGGAFDVSIPLPSDDDILSVSCRVVRMHSLPHDSTLKQLCLIESKRVQDVPFDFGLVAQ